MNRIIILLGIFFYFYCEISFIIAIGSSIGALGVILLLIAISALGIWLIRLQGIIALANVQKKMAIGASLTKDITTSAIIVIAGFLFIIPGFLSDILAILLLIPFTRKILQSLVLDLIFRKFQFASFHQFTQYSNKKNETIFDAEFERHEDNFDENKRIR